MNRRDLTVLVCRFLALVLLGKAFLSISGVAGLIPILMRNSPGGSFWSNLAPFWGGIINLLILINLSILLWRFADPIGFLMIGGREEEVSVSLASPQDWLSAALAGLGFFCISMTLNNIQPIIFYVFIRPEYTLQLNADISVFISQMLFGLFLILCCKPISHFVLKLQDTQITRFNKEKPVDSQENV